MVHAVAARAGRGAGTWRDVPGTRVEVDVDLGFTGGPGFFVDGLALRPDV
jgi:hypothetical protein